MQTTLKELDKIWPVVQVLGNVRDLPPAKKQLLYRLVRVAEPEILNFRSSRNLLIKKHGKLVGGAGDTWQIPPEAQPEYASALAPLENLSLELPDVGFTEDELSGPLTVAEMLVVGCLLAVPGSQPPAKNKDEA